MHVQSQTIPVTTDAQQAATVYSQPINGEIYSVSYVKSGGQSPFSNGVDFSITLERTGQAVWVQQNVDASKTVYPLRLAQDTAGVDLVASADIPNRVPIKVGGERVKIVIAEGGAAKVGTFEITWAGPSS